MAEGEGDGIESRLTFKIFSTLSSIILNPCFFNHFRLNFVDKRKRPKNSGSKVKIQMGPAGAPKEILCLRPKIGPVNSFRVKQEQEEFL